LALNVFDRTVFREELTMLQEADIVQDWINEGLQKGIGIGMEQGEVKAIREAILDVLSERFGTFRKGLSKKLGAIDDPAVLRSLLRKSIRVKSLEEFARLLEEI